MKPSSLKLNSRQHRFALNILAGLPPQQAYIAAGYSPDSADCEPYTLQSLPRVANFIQEKRRLKEAVVLASDINATIASPQERKQILTELLRGQLVDFVDDNGQPKLDKDVPNHRAAREYSHRTHYNQQGEAIVTKSIKLTDPIAAIAELNKMDGSYAPQKHLVAEKVQIEIVHTPRKRIADVETGPDAAATG